MKNILVALLCAVVMPLAFAHPPGTGLVSYKQDLLPIINANPLLSSLVKEEFTVTNDTAMGTRIGDSMAPALGGTRIGPYYVDAIWHSKSGDKLVSLTIYTEVQFFDNSGKLLGDDIGSAAKVVETFDGIAIEKPGL